MTNSKLREHINWFSSNFPQHAEAKARVSQIVDALLAARMIRESAMGELRRMRKHFEECGPCGECFEDCQEMERAAS